MRDEDAFLRAVLADPDDDAPRLIYADWLDEHDAGDGRRAARAEFIRLQCALERLPEDDSRRPVLIRREGALEAAQRRDWAKRLGDLGVTDFVLVRGFPEYVQMPAPAFLADAPVLFRSAPVRSLTLTALRPDEVGPVAACEYLSRLTSLDLSGNPLGPAGAGALAGSPHLRRLTRLDLAQCGLGDAGVEVVAHSPSWPRLTSLALGFNGIGLAGVRALAASPHLAGLTSLALVCNELGPVAARVLARSPTLRRLASLNLALDHIGDRGVRALAASPHAENLRALVLVGNGISSAGAQALAAAPHLRRLTALNVRDNHLGDEGVRALVSSAGLGGLVSLDVVGTDLGAEGARELAGSTVPAGLRQLSLDAALEPVFTHALAAAGWCGPKGRSSRPLPALAVVNGLDAARLVRQCRRRSWQDTVLHQDNRVRGPEL